MNVDLNMTGQTDANFGDLSRPFSPSPYFLNTAYQSQQNLPPFIFADNSSVASLPGLMVQINEWMATLESTVLESKHRAILSSEKELRQAIAIDQPTFKAKFPIRRLLLRSIMIVAKSYAFQTESFQWGGPTDFINDRQLQAVCHFAKLVMICVTGAHSHLITTGKTNMQPDDGVSYYPVHVSMWASRAILTEPIKFKRTTHDVVQKSLKFSSNPGHEQNNIDRYLEAIKDRWYVQNQSTIVRSIQQHFFLKKYGMAFEVEEVQALYGPSLNIVLPNCPFVVS